MAGMPKRRQRDRIGAPTPLPGNPAADDPRLLSRTDADVHAHARDIIADLPDDAALFVEAKAILLELARGAEDDKNRVSAARALIDAVKPREIKSDDAGLDKLPADQLMAEVDAAKRALGEGDGVRQ